MTTSALTIQQTKSPLEREIRQDNAITNARYEMTANEMDIFFCVLSCLKPTDNAGTLYRVYVKDLQEKTGREWNYNQLKESASKLRTKEIYHVTERSLLEANIFASCEYIKGEGCVEIELSVKVRPYLFELKNNYTSYRLYSVMSLTSTFAKRIYQLCSRWKDVGQFRIKLDELKIMLGLKDPNDPTTEKYTKLTAFKEKVLEIAKTQINAAENSDLKMDYEIEKNKKKDYDIIFYIDRQKPKQLPLEFNENSAENIKLNNLKNNLTKIGIVRQDVVKKILEDHSVEAGKWFYQLNIGNIKAQNPAGHLLTSLGLV